MIESKTNIINAIIETMVFSDNSKVKSRIILTPQHAKRLLKAISDNIHRYESANGEIKDVDKSPIPLSFGPAGQA